ncbi:MAG: FkbM family methyltransferase [Proteobacteria bacterium]|nr:FkbM family methyltransferase [Pseudomonadota bacterium]
MSLALASADLPSPDDEKLYQLIRSGWTVVAAGVRDDAWIQACAQARPGARYLVFPHDADAQAGLARSLRPFSNDITVNACPAGRPSTAGVAVATLDEARDDRRFNHVHYLRIDTAAAALDILLGAKKLLRHSRIDLIEIAPTPLGTEGLAPLAFLLEHHDYVVMRLEGDAFKRLSQAELAASRWTGHTVAIHTRLLTQFTKAELEILDLPQLLTKFGIAARGVIHVGAHEGEELPTYLELGAKQVLLIEANPRLIDHLRSLVATTPGVTVAHCAINDADGPVDLHIASHDDSSSILPLKLHQRIYPTIVEDAVVQVPGLRLDGLMESLALNAADFNILCVDIQGAELRALRGAVKALEAIEAVSIEINFEELYEGCAQVEDIDNFLGDRGFDRVATLTPYHSSWGDALYVRRGFALAPRPLQ